MIIFLEGLPRSGKSHSFMKDHAIPALQKGRQVYTNVAGLDFEKIAMVSGLGIEKVRELLHQLTEEQVPTWWQHVQNDSLVGLDEMQDYWPASREALSKEVSESITRHGHRGLDVVGMGQNLKDVHQLWRRRVDRKYVFVKRDVLGKDGSYQWSTWKSVGGDKFEKITSGTAEYDPLIFGCYRSHDPGTENKEVYADKNAVIWNNPMFRKWLPLFGVLLVMSVGYLWKLFHPSVEEKKPPSVPRQAEQQQARSVPPAPPALVPAPKEADFSFPESVDPIEQLNKSARSRLLGFYRVGQKTDGIIEWRGPDNKIVDSRKFSDLSALGWTVFVNQDATLANVVKGSRRFVAASWPIFDTDGKATENRIDKVRIASGYSSSDGLPLKADQ